MRIIRPQALFVFPHQILKFQILRFQIFNFPFPKRTDRQQVVRKEAVFPEKKAPRPRSVFTNVEKLRENTPCILWKKSPICEIAEKTSLFIASIFSINFKNENNAGRADSRSTNCGSLEPDEPVII
jgi:hypothetical protein